MKTLKFYKYFAFTMLVLNITMVLFFMFNKSDTPDRHHHHKMGPPPMLNLSESQAKAFHDLAHGHKTEMRDIMEQQKAILMRYFQPLYQSGARKDSAQLSEFYTLEQQKIESTYSHFEDVKKLLNKDQLINYPEFVEKTLGLILGKRKGPHPPHPRK